MVGKLFRSIIVLALLVSLVIPLLAQGQAGSSVPLGQPRGPLTEEENPLLIGKRNVNKHQINFYSLEKEAAAGRQFAADVDRSVKLIDDPIVVEYINRVGQNIVLNSDAKVPFTIKVIDTDEVNAFALPGGFFYVNKGLILAADNESEIACVMAHEIGHVCARHQMEQASKGQIANFAMIPLIIFTGGIAGIAAQNAANILVPMGFLKFTRNAEAEADMLGAQYAWAAGYDPNGMLTFFEKIQGKEKKKPGTISKLFDSHPPTPERIEKTRNLLARFPERNEYVVTTSDFDKVKNRLAVITHTHRLGEKDTGPKKPTLKRKGSGDDTSDPNAPKTDKKDSSAPNKPTLNRKGNPPDKPDNQ